MEQTLELLDYIFRRKYQTIHTGKWNARTVIRNIQLGPWDGSGHERKENRRRARTLYLLPVESWSRFSTEKVQTESGEDIILIILSSETWKREYQGRAGYYLICDSGKALEVLNDVLCIWQECRDWQRNLMKKTECLQDFQNQVNSAAEYLNVNVAVISRDYHLEYESISIYSESYDLMYDENKYLKEDDIANLYLIDPKFDTTFEKQEMTYYRDYTDEDLILECYYRNIFRDNRYIARILFVFRKEDSDPALLGILEWVSDRIIDAYMDQFYQKRIFDKKMQIRGIFEKLLEGGQLNAEQMATSLGILNWKIYDHYIAAKLVPRSYSNSRQTMEYYGAKLEEVFSQCLSLPVASGIYCLFNMTEMKENPARTISVFLRENMFIAGFGQVFSDCRLFRTYCEEAEATLAIGMEQYPDLWIHEFRNYALTYSILQMKSHFPGKDLRHPALGVLEEYDRHHPDTELKKTLQIYLEERFNASHAADRLHIHRTTFLYRMQKLQEIVPLNFEDPDEVLHLMLSYRL